MIRFDTDYQEGCHPRILERLRETNLEQTPGYGEDEHCARARALIQDAVGLPEAEVHFLVGGTQTNTTVIRTILNPIQGVACVDTGHVNVHESGAIEGTGHKVLTLPGHGGLLEAEAVVGYVEDFHADPTGRDHKVHPGMVYISHPSECGTLYPLRQLEDIREVCDRYGFPIFMDGARLGYGLVARGTDVTLKDVARLCDVFYIGGTKVGALFGEAVVIPRPEELKRRLPNFRFFRTITKQQGGLLAKGRLLGIQFEALFEDGLYLEISRHADQQALRIREAFEAKGIPMLFDSVTNQQFPILTDGQSERLLKDFSFEPWQRMEDGRQAVRFCTSWATESKNVDALVSAIGAL